MFGQLKKLLKFVFLAIETGEIITIGFDETVKTNAIFVVFYLNNLPKTKIK